MSFAPNLYFVKIFISEAEKACDKLHYINKNHLISSQFEKYDVTVISKETLQINWNLILWILCGCKFVCSLKLKSEIKAFALFPVQIWVRSSCRIWLFAKLEQFTENQIIPN